MFGFGELVTTVVFATYAAGVIAGLVLFGHWSDQVGRRPMLHAGLVLSGLSAVVFAVAGGWAGYSSAESCLAYRPAL